MAGLRPALLAWLREAGPSRILAVGPQALSRKQDPSPTITESDDPQGQRATGRLLQPVAKAMRSYSRAPSTAVILHPAFWLVNCRGWPGPRPHASTAAPPVNGRGIAAQQRAESSPLTTIRASRLCCQHLSESSARVSPPPLSGKRFPG